MTQPVPPGTFFVSKLPRIRSLLERNFVSWEVGEALPFIKPEAGTATPLPHIIVAIVPPHYDEDGFPIAAYTVVAQAPPSSIVDSFTKEQLGQSAGVPLDQMAAWLADPTVNVEGLREDARRIFAKHEGKMLQIRVREEEVMYPVEEDTTEATAAWLDRPRARYVPGVETADEAAGGEGEPGEAESEETDADAAE